MAAPRVFISSTYYDLRYVRSSLSNHVGSLGFKPVLSEKGDIPYAHTVPLDESCYRTVEGCDILVLIIGGRYGSAASTQPESLSHDEATAEEVAAAKVRYESITKKEYRAALDAGIPTYICVDANVLAEFQTFRKNPGNTSIQYAHVDSRSIFLLIEDVLAQPYGNPVQAFTTPDEIEGWLMKQWAGLFQDLLKQAKVARQIQSLESQIQNLGEISQTMKSYLEDIVRATSTAPDQRLEDRISETTEKLKAKSLKHNPFYQWLQARHDMAVEDFRRVLESAASRQALASELAVVLGDVSMVDALGSTPATDRAWRDLDRARQDLGLEPFPD